MVHRIHNAVVATAALSSVAFLATTALLAPAGCTVLTDDALPDDAGPESSGPIGEAGPAATCAGCTSQACIGPMAVCFSDKDCLTQHFCTKSTGCACAAEAGSPEVLSKIAAVTRCNAEKSCSQCANECASTCSADAASSNCGADGGDDADAGTSTDAATDADTGSDAEAGLPPSVDGCMACVNTECVTPRGSCAAGTSCAAFLTCVDACADTACAEDCGQRFADGKAKATELSNCTLAGCRGACAL